MTLEVSSGKDGRVSQRPIPSLFGEGGRDKSQSVFGEARPLPSCPPGPREPHKVHTPGRVSSGEPGPRQVTAESQREGGIRGREGPLRRAKPRKTPARGGRKGWEGKAGREQPSCKAGSLKIIKRGGKKGKRVKNMK